MNRRLRHVLLLPLVFALVTPVVLGADAVEVDQLARRLGDLEAYVNSGAKSDASVLTAGPAHNAWLMISSALVFFMTLPGLAMFYGGLVRRKNVLSVLAQCLGIAGLVTFLWWLAGYSLVFGEGTPVIGGLKKGFLSGVGPLPNPVYSPWVSESVFAMFQLMFAIITPALMIGAIAERMRFSALMLFIGLWMVFVYFPLAHMVWGADGLMNGVWNAGAKIKAIDFAGGMVVHMSSGWSALLLCLLVGRRHLNRHAPVVPHNLVICMLGTGVLWFGWYGFNAGSALAPDGIAANAFVTTTIAAALGGAAWAAIEYVAKGKPSVLGFCSGAVGGLVAITPGAGYVGASAAVVIGILAGLATYFGCSKLKTWLGYDDALDTFGIHGVGGTLGSVLTGVFATASVNPNLTTNLAGDLGCRLILSNLVASGVTVLVAVVGTLLAALITKVLLGELRVPIDAEIAGLDVTEHGEEGYKF